MIWLAQLILYADWNGPVKYQFFTFYLGTVAIGSNCCVLRCGSDTCCHMCASVTQLEKENFKFPCFKLCFKSIFGKGLPYILSCFSDPFWEGFSSIFSLL